MQKNTKYQIYVHSQVTNTSYKMPNTHSLIAFAPKYQNQIGFLFATQVSWEEAELQLARCGFPSEEEDWPKTGLVGLAVRQQSPPVACNLPTGHTGARGRKDKGKSEAEEKELWRFSALEWFETLVILWRRGKMEKGGKDQKVLAQAAKHFEKFFTSEVRWRSSREQMLLEDDSQVFADIMDNFASVCELLGVQRGNFTHFYPDLKVSKECKYVDESLRFVQTI